jgi:hypothetical protein
VRLVEHHHLEALGRQLVGGLGKEVVADDEGVEAARQRRLHVCKRVWT